MKAYKIFRKKANGDITALFINKSVGLPIGEWMTAECIPTKGFAVRKGWHCTFTQLAPHLKVGEGVGKNRAWFEVEVEDFTTYDRPESQGGSWILANRMKIIKEVVR